MEQTKKHTYYRAYKYRLYPNATQRELIAKNIGCCRLIYNVALEYCQTLYKDYDIKVKKNDVINQLPELKEAFPFLKECYSQSLQQSVFDLFDAYDRFFKGQCGYPKFKSKKHHKQSFRIPQHIKLKEENGKSYICMPKLGQIEYVKDRGIHPNGKIKSATISVTKTGKYFVSVLVEIQEPLPEKKPIEQISNNKSIGIDVGLKDYLVLSDGQKITNFARYERITYAIKKLQRRLSKKVEGSKNYYKVKRKIALLYEKKNNYATDIKHKLTTKIVRNYDVIVIEDLNVKGMLKNHKLSRSIWESGWSEFTRMLEYKSEWYGKHLIRINRFEPSSKLCSVCGYKNDNLTLKDREWTCPECGTHHDRDINAAINIKNIGLGRQPVTACGDKTPNEGVGMSPVNNRRAKGIQIEASNF